MKQFILLVLCIHGYFFSQSVWAEWKVTEATDWNEEVRVWDQAPELKALFNWNGKTNEKHEADGKGSLEWYIVKPYKVVSRYTGEMRYGRREGHGVWNHHSGTRYEGAWKDNVKHGYGEYSTNDGDYYKGEFKNDQMDGKGLWVGVDGLVYDGGFVEGKREGNAKLTLPDGTMRDSVWKGGRETDAPGKAENLQPSVMLAMDRGKYASEGEVEQQIEEHDTFQYVGSYEEGNLVVVPEFELWRLWQKGEPLVRNYSIRDDETMDPSIFPAYLEVRVFNPGGKALSIVGAEVEAMESHADLEPLLEIGDADDILGGVTCGLRNFKDTKVDACEIAYKFQGDQEVPVYSDFKYKADVSPFTGSALFSIAEAIADYGIDVNELKKIYQKLEDIPHDVSDGERKKLRGGIKQEILKSLGEHGKTAMKEGEEISFVTVQVVGEMKVSWTNHQGDSVSSVMKFAFPKTIQGIMAEGGSAGPSSGKFDVMLPVTGKNYSKPFTYRKNLRAGGQDRFALRVASEGSSKHEFRVRLTTADGGVIVSKPCRLTYLVPRRFTWEKGYVYE